MVTLYTDGGCWPNPGPGGWGCVILRDGQQPEEHSGSIDGATNNRAELTAAIEGLTRIGGSENVLLISDSMLLINGAKGLWRRRKNQDLWFRLKAAADLHKSVTYQWVKGHSGNGHNERCDQLARLQVKAAAS